MRFIGKDGLSRVQPLSKGGQLLIPFKVLFSLLLIGSAGGFSRWQYRKNCEIEVPPATLPTAKLPHTERSRAGSQFMLEDKALEDPLLREHASVQQFLFFR